MQGFFACLSLRFFALLSMTEGEGMTNGILLMVCLLSVAKEMMRQRSPLHSAATSLLLVTIWLLKNSLYSITV
jgi:hypothetical protein